MHQKLGIIGCGWLGGRLAKYFSEKWEIHATTTSFEKQKELKKSHFYTEIIQFSNEKMDKNLQKWQKLNDLDAIIVTIPFGKKSKEMELKNRFQNLIYFIENYQKPLFLMSSIGIYPEISQKISENSLPENLLNINILGVEKMMQKYFPQINILRLGGLMGENRNLKNYPLTDLQKPVNHIHYQEVIFVIEKMLLQNFSAKIYNLVAPLYPTKAEILSGEFEEKSIENQRIISSELLIKELNYNFFYPNPVFF